ncbi:MAG: hypothetical protein HRU40_17035 [Saprospiraceae bacterium]|nr:hypothetical protein [Saprospiraceae bacterium]
MRNITLVFGLIMLITGCQSNESELESLDNGSRLPDDFVAFYTQFHKDSAFQMDHIVWPLQGVPDNAGNRITDQSFRWQKNNWRLMQPIDYASSGYERSFLPMTDELIIEKIAHKNGSMALIRRFAIISGEWHLIYYAGLNPIKD